MSIPLSTSTRVFLAQLQRRNAYALVRGGARVEDAARNATELVSRLEQMLVSGELTDMGESDFPGAQDSEEAALGVVGDDRRPEQMRLGGKS